MKKIVTYVCMYVGDLLAPNVNHMCMYVCKAVYICEVCMYVRWCTYILLKMKKDVGMTSQKSEGTR